MTATVNPGRTRVVYEHRPQALAELTAADLLAPAAASVPEDATLWEALERFLIHHTRHLAVVDHRRRFRGLLSDRHLMGRAWLDERTLQRCLVRDVGCLDRPVLAPETGLTAVAQVLTEYEADAAPVVDERGTVLGVVTRAAVVRAVADHGPIAARRR